MDIIARINELMSKKGWTAYALSKQTGISTNTIYDWNKGAIPSLENVLKVCDAMDITAEQFFCGVQSYKLSDEENKILQEWFVLSDLEKKAMFSMIDTFKVLKRD